MGLWESLAVTRCLQPSHSSSSPEQGLADTAVCHGRKGWKDISLEGMGSVFTPRKLLSSEWLQSTSKTCPLLSAATTSGKHQQVKAHCIPWSAPEPSTSSSPGFFFSLIIISQNFACERLHHFIYRALGESFIWKGEELFPLYSSSKTTELTECPHCQGGK